MVEFEPSRSLDDLLGLAVPSTQSVPVVQHRSRRELREAEAAAGRRSRGTPPVPVAPAAVAGRIEPLAAPAQPPSSRAHQRAALAARSDRRTARATSRPSRPAHRRKPHGVLKALVTMTAVGGLFGVAGLPAYASLSQPDSPPLVAATPDSGAVQSLTLASTIEGAQASRDGFEATTPEELANQTRDAMRAANNSAYLLSGAREMGDDYPWFYELSSDQGGGLSPLNYYYRECVDFVAWRLNRDAGYTKAPFKWVWSNLTPSGGDGSQWRYAWEAKGWPVSDVPIPGSVAVIGYNHVAYVKQVNDDGTVLLEEYNYNYSHTYGQRTVPASQASAYLYPPS